MRTDLLALGVFGAPSRLRERIETLLTHRAPHSRRGWLSVSVLAAALITCALTTPFTPRWIAFAQRLEFEVASVRSNDDAATESFLRVNPAGIDFSRAPLTRIIAEGYQIPYARITASNSHIRELLSETYDIRAKADHAASWDQLMLMLQALLQDRFKLSFHRESNVEAVYKLAALKEGPKLSESTSESGLAAGALTPNGVVFRNMTMWRFAAFLTGRLDRPVVDATGLTGVYDFNLQLQTLRDLTQLDPGAAKPVANDWSSSSILVDIRKLGLSLEASKAPVDYLRIDHAEKPDAN